MFRLSLLLVFCLFLTGCTGDKTPMKAEIVSVYKEDTKWGCIATDHKTLIKTEDGFTYDKCGILGEVGDEVMGCLRTGHWDANVNGWRSGHC